MPRPRSHSLSPANFLVLLVLAGGIFYVANRGLVSYQGGGPLDETPVGIVTPAIVQTDASTDEESTELPAVAVSVKGGGTTKLVLRPHSGDEKLLFTDADEGNKISTGLGSNFRDALYAWVTSQIDATSGQVASISTGGSGSLTLLGEPIVSTAPPAISPDGSRVAQIGFDNSEGSFGFTLLTNRTSGGELRALDSSPEGISLPRWSANGQLAYVVGQATPDKGQELRVQAGDTATKRFTSDAKQLISDLAWLGNDQLAIVVEPLGNNTANSAKILIIKATDGSVVSTIDKPGKERGLQATSTGSVLGFIAGEVSGLAAKAGTVTLIDLGSKSETTRGEAHAVAGFLQ